MGRDPAPMKTHGGALTCFSSYPLHELTPQRWSTAAIHESYIAVMPYHCEGDVLAAHFFAQ